MAEKRCTGTRKNRNGEVIPCTRIIAEIDYANDARLRIKCPSCGTMNIIEATPKLMRTESKNILSGLGIYPIQEIST
jgi:phage FluMu protein Com